MSSLRSTGFTFVVFLFCPLSVSCPIAQSVLAMEENPQFINNSVLKVSSRTSLRANKGLLAQYEVASNFAENGSKEGGGVIARKMRNLLRDNSEMKSSETGEEGAAGSSREKRSSISEGADEKYPGFTGNTMKVGLDVRPRLRLRSKLKGKGRDGGGQAGGFVAFNSDYHFPRLHPPRNN